MPTPALVQKPETDPLDLYRCRDGLYAVDLLAAALVHLDFFSWLAAHPSDLAGICRSLELAPRPTDVMLTLFAAMGLVENGSGLFRVTQKAEEFLLKESPWNLGPYYASLKDRPVTLDFVQVLRTGRAANWGSFKNEKDWARAMEDDAFAQQFTAAMDCRGLYLGPALAEAVDLQRHRRLLDVAGGSGIYACALVTSHPHLQATVFEKPPVDQVARRAIARRSLSERVQVRAGDMFVDPFPPEHDVHLISNVLHDWDEPVVKQLLRKSFAALPPGGRLLIHDVHINETKTGPLPAAQYSCILMHSTEGKCYALPELRSYFDEIGFREMTFQPTAADRSVVSAMRP